MKFYHYSDSDRFQGCIGQVTHNAPGKPAEPLPLLNSSETGRSCEGQCIFGGKCDNHTDDVDKSDEECECPGYEVEKQICKENLTHAQKSLSIGFNKTNAFSTKVTPNLMSSRQIQALPTTASLSNSTTSSSLDIALEYLKYGSSSVTAAYSTRSRQRSGSAAFSSSSSIISISAKPSSSAAGPFSSSIDNQAEVMAKKSSAFFSRGSCVLLCLGSLVAVQSSWPIYV